MKTTLLIALLSLTVFPVVSQVNTGVESKRPIDEGAYRRWPEISQQKICNDGSFVSYVIAQGGEPATLVLQATDNSWKTEVAGGFNASFSEDSKKIFFQLPSDSLVILNSITKEQTRIPNVKSYQLSAEGKGAWLAYHKSDSSGAVTVRNLANGIEKSFKHVSQFLLKGKLLILQDRISEDSGMVFNVILVRLPDSRPQTIWRSKKPASNFAFDKAEKQLAFIDEKETGNSIIYYRDGMNWASIWVSFESPQIEKGMEVAAGEMKFSRNGQKLFFPLQKSRIKSKPKAVEQAQVEVWSYQDVYLQPQKMKKVENEGQRIFHAIIHVGQERIIRLEQEEDDWTSFEMADGGDAEFIVIRNKYDWSQEHWNPTSRINFTLVSTISGKRIIVAERVRSGYHGNLYSPKGKFLIWYDRQQHHYFCYNISTGRTINISQSVPIPLFNEEEEHPMLPYPIGIAGWLEKEEAVLVYDQYDIWQLDPLGVRKPVNVTNGYGRRTGIYLRYLPVKHKSGTGSVTIKSGESLLLCGLDSRTKDNGFFRTQPGSQGDPTKLTMGPYLYYYCFSFLPRPDLSLWPNFILKAREADVYFLNRMSVEHYPNLYATSDFNSLVPLSNLQPEKAYNWLTSELVRWKTVDGKEAEGILYKPEDFDPKKRYPVIFYFYEKDANALHNYLRPDYTDGQINVPTFVSNGYLVCNVNISYKVGEPMESVYNSVVSAARYLSRMPWVDSTKMGIQGHSFGGYEVNCLISRTGLFAAAVSAAGFSDLISMYGNLRSDFGVTGLDMIEAGQTGIGSTLWENPDLFVKNSPIFYADKVTTPLLLMHNKSDGASPFSQSVELFTGLRRLKKPVWLLHYDNSGHQVEGEQNQRDFSERLLQFFNHYLKSTPAPAWMRTENLQGSKEMQSGTENQ